MKNILAPIDFSAATDRVCEAAATLAKAVNGRVVLLHSVPPPIVTTEYGPMIENLAEITANSEKAAAKHLARLRKKIEDQLVVTEAMQFLGAPGPNILSHAETLAADYIVMGSHGHTALYELLVGSTTHHVLMKANCPVVIVPPEKKAASKRPAGAAAAPTLNAER
jgi:nucleotide-binding universal stress UspA family protein